MLGHRLDGHRVPRPPRRRGALPGGARVARTSAPEEALESNRYAGMVSDSQEVRHGGKRRSQPITLGHGRYRKRPRYGQVGIVESD